MIDELLDSRGRPLVVDQLVTILDFKGDRRGEMWPGWNEEMIALIGTQHKVSAFKLYDRKVVTLAGVKWDWLSRWLQCTGGLRELVDRYRKDEHVN